MANIQKVAIIGCGYVGATCAFSLINSGLFAEMVLIDANQEKAEGEAMDLSHGGAYQNPMKIYAGNYDDIVDAGIIIITAGANQKPNETRLDLVKKNIAIFKEIIPEIRKRACEGILLIVSNPVDILTYAAIRLSHFPSHRVFGSGTVLDTARLKYVLGDQLQVDPRNVHACIIGEHGDSELALWSSAVIGVTPLSTYCSLYTHEHQDRFMHTLYEEVRDSAYEIIQRKGATYYGIAAAVKRIASAIVKNEHAILPVSIELKGEMGFDDLCLSIPAVVGRNGIEHIVPPLLNDEERKMLKTSADTLKKVLKDLETDL